MSTRLFFHHHAAPIGMLRLFSDGEALIGLETAEQSNGRVRRADCTEDHAPFREVCRQLDRYFAREATTFDVPLVLRGTPFEQAVWAELRKIPFGATISYATLALCMGNPLAVRAVGRANGKNPVSIIVPCHRVIGSDGSLTGYAGGIACKRALLELEGAQAVAREPARQIGIDYGSCAALAMDAVR